MEKDVRWIQRFSNFNKALSKLTEAIDLIKREHFADEQLDPESFKNGNDIIKEGLIQRFEYTHELAWNIMKDYAHYQVNATVAGSRDATREALTLNLITDGHIWMDMIANRNKTSHTYNEETADEIFENIIFNYHPLFIKFQETMTGKLSGDLFN